MPIVPGRLLFQTAYCTISTFYVPGRTSPHQLSPRKALYGLGPTLGKTPMYGPFARGGSPQLQLSEVLDGADHLRGVAVLV